LLWLC